MTKTKAPAAKPPKKATARVVRIAALKNPDTGREVLVRVNADGAVGDRRYQEKFGKTVARWTEVEAAGWAAATKLLRAGKGKKVRAS